MNQIWTNIIWVACQRCDRHHLFGIGLTWVFPMLKEPVLVCDRCQERL